MNQKKHSTHAMRWSSDFVVAEYRNIQAKAITLDYTNTFLFLPTKMHFAFKNLNSPIDEIMTIPRHSKIEPGPAAWSPHSHSRELCALALHTRVELFSLKNYSDLSTNNLLKSHTRVVTGLNWHPMDPNLIATCSLDTFTYIWDIREPQKPAISLSSFAAVSHVKWSKLSRHLLATVHGGDVKIWDERKYSSPVQYISSNLTSVSSTVHCLDWCHFKENQICTASQDGTVKFFDINNPRKTELLINADSPVWRAGYTPFGRGLLVVVIPTARRTENNLLLWNLTNNNIPLHTFVGHTEIVLDFQWRYFQQDGSEYQLITWSKDQTLRIWEIDKYLQELCGEEKTEEDSDVVDCAVSSVTDEIASSLESVITNKKFDIQPSDKEVISTSSSSASETNEILQQSTSFENNVESTSSSSDLNSKNMTTGIGASPVNLQQEFSLNINIPNVQIIKTDIIRRVCCATAKCNGQIISIYIHFPPSYPRNKGPIFKFASGTTATNEMRCKILEALRDTADFKVKSNEACLEACLRTLIVTLQQLTSNETEKLNFFAGDGPLTERISSNQDAYFLPARTCGAKFGFVDKLICFAKPSTQFQGSDRNVFGLVNLSNRQQETITRICFQNRNGMLPPRSRYIIRRGLLKRMKNTRQNKRTVLVYDVSSLFLLNKELAIRYKLSNQDLSSTCTHNAQIAASLGRRDLQQVWNLLLISATTVNNNCNEGLDWERHPLAKQMLQSIILFYVSQSDIQTAATLCCIFRHHLSCSENEQNKPRPFRPSSKTPSGSPYHTIHPTSIDTSLDSAWSFPSRKLGRSSSWSEFLEDIEPSNIVESVEAIDTVDMPTLIPKSNKGKKYELLFDRVIQAYGDILHRWQLLTVRGMIMKSVDHDSIEEYKGLETVAECQNCKNLVLNKICSKCKSSALYCVICRLSVKGLASVCMKCGHGGHLSHMRQWYESDTCCPLGCKCECFLSFANLAIN